MACFDAVHHSQFPNTTRPWSPSRQRRTSAW
jgi:hypothetical protein